MVSGSLSSPAAIFIYKDDKSARPAWDAALAIDAAEGEIRAELHSERDSFLAALTEWNISVDPVNSYLCIYSHAGRNGITSDGSKNPSVFVTWQELAAALSLGVRRLWLLGCATDSSLDIWSTLDSPIAHHLLVTTESAYWLPFLKFFAWEISVDNIATTEDIVERLKETSPELAEHTAQYIFDGWTPGT